MTAAGVGDVLATPLQFLKGVGPRRAADLEHAGLITLEDLLYRFPIRYEDRSRLQPIASLKPGQTASVAGRDAQLRPPLDAPAGIQDLRGARSTTAADRCARSWLNQPFLQRRLHAAASTSCSTAPSRCAARSACS